MTSLKIWMEPTMKIAAVLKQVAIRTQRMYSTGAGRFALGVGAACAICAAGNLQAAYIQGVTIAGVSFQNFSYPSTATYSVTNLVSSVGLYGDVHSSLPGGSMWWTGSGQPGTNFVTFNLGGVYTLNAIKVWNYNDSSQNPPKYLSLGVSNAVVSYSTDGVNFTTNIPSQNFNRAPGDYTAYGQTITLPSPVSAQYIRFDIKTNWAGGANGVGLAKVRFISDTNPPAVLSASENYGSNQITVLFSESVDAASATNPANYSISGGGPAPTISSVDLGEYADRVVLHTSSLANDNYSVSVSGVYDEALTATVTNNATVAVQPEVYLWLKADQGVTTTPAFGGNMLTAWNDQSSYGHNAQPANFFNVLTNQPFLIPSVVNGLPAVQFFGTNVMQIPNDPANPINGDMTLFMVVSTSTNSGNLDPINKTGGGSNATTTNNLAAPFDFYIGGGRPTFNFGNNGVSANSIQGGANFSTNTFYVVALSVTGNRAKNLGQITVDGVPAIDYLGTTPANWLSFYSQFPDAPADAGNPICIGARNSGTSSNPFNGYLSEVMLVRGSITSNDFVNIENYLAAKYNIAPPTITEQPASLTANAGNQATFWVTATGEMPFSYQWQSNGVPIPGATGASHTTPYLTSSANGASYTVTVAGPTGTNNSAAATLTVVTPTTAPTVFSAAKTAGLTSVVVVFSEAIDGTTGLNPANYSIDNGISVVSAAAGTSPNQVVLTTPLMDPNGLYHLTVQNVQDQYGNATAAVIVPIMPANLTMWLRADSGVVTNANAGNPSEVDAWLDQTANGNNAQTYGGAGYRPSLGFDPINGLAALQFNSGAKNFLVAPSSPGVALTGDMGAYVVANFSDFTAYREVVSKGTGGSAQPWEFRQATSSGKIQWSRGLGSPKTATSTGGTAPTTGQPSAQCVSQQGVAMNAWLNGVVNNGASFSFTDYTDIGSPVYIGARNSWDANVLMNGNIQEIMIFSNTISGADRTNIDNYVGAKYFSLTVTTPLTNETVPAGSMATFSVGAKQGPAHPTYQWVENTTNIPGATGLSYTTPRLRTSDNGDQFSVLVIVGSVTNTVGPVTLTVNSVPPVVQNYGAAIWGTNMLVVNFQTPLNPSIATNLANYSLDNGATVLSVTLLSPTEVLLTTSPLATGAIYTLTVQNLQDQFGSVMTTTNIVNVTTNYPNVALWLRADEGISAQNGDPVGEWDDQSGNGNNFTGDIGFEPTFVTNAVNGWPALLFNGTNQTYLYDNSGSPTLALTGDMTIFAVMNFTTYLSPSGQSNAPGGGEIISKNDPLNKNIPSSYDYYVYYGGGQAPMLLRGNGTTAQSPFAGAANSPSTGVWHELSAMSQGNSEWHRLDGYTNGAPVTWSVTGGVADTGGLVIIGERTDGNVRLTGEMAELIVVGSALSTSDVTAIETHLGNKYGLIASPKLAIATTNANALVSWQLPQWSFILQSTPNLSPATWSAVTNAPILISNTNAVTLPMGANPMFYRLKSQSQ